MRPIAIGLIAAIVAAIILPTTALAATAAKTPPVDPNSIKTGMAAAPGVIASAGLDCTLANARFLGKSADPKTKLASNYYELACKNQEGFIVATPDKPDPAAPPPQIFTCLEADNTPKSGAQCVLPENADHKQGLLALVAANRPSCQMSNARAIGQTNDRKMTVFEVACQGGIGYVIQSSFPVSAAKPATFIACFSIPAGSQMACTLTDSSGLAGYVDTLVAKMGKPCVVKDRRYVGATSDESSFFEVACQDGKGYMVETSAKGDVKPGIDCAVADAIGGGCTLTNARAAQTEQDALYARLAHNAGFACDVNRYAPFTVNVPGHEVVELACANRPDGAIGIFPASSSQPSQIIDCAHSELAGYRCSFTKADAALPALTDDLKKLGKNSCVVSAERIVGITPDKMGYIEVGCADGNAGYLVSYVTPAMTPKEAIVCTLARDILGGCQLPGNSAKH